MIRAFIAADLPDLIKSEIAARIKPLQQPDLISSIKWVEPKNFHITLKFLGDTTPEKIETLAEKIKAELHPMNPVALKLAELGAFPNNHKPTVLWVDVFPKEQLLTIYKTIEQVCITQGFRADQKPFKSHITVARLKRGNNPDPIKKISLFLQNDAPSKPINFYIDGITIFQSVLTPRGPRYTPLRFID